MSRLFRLVSFNILEGLRPLGPSLSERRLIDRERKAAARAVVAELDPDILVLNEALFCREFAGNTVNYAEVFHFPYQSAALYEDAWGNAILSRFPITKAKEMRIYNRGGLVATLDTTDGPVTVASYHPHPQRQPENKALDFSRLVAGLTGPVVVCGDFNCISPEDPIDRRQLVEAFRKFSTSAAVAVERYIDSGRHVFDVLAKLGFRDAIPQAGRRYSMPTDLINRDKSSAMRMTALWWLAAKWFTRRPPIAPATTIRSGSSFESVTNTARLSVRLFAPHAPENVGGSS